MISPDRSHALPGWDHTVVVYNQGQFLHAHEVPGEPQQVSEDALCEPWPLEARQEAEPEVRVWARMGRDEAYRAAYLARQLHFFGDVRVLRARLAVPQLSGGIC